MSVKDGRTLSVNVFDEQVTGAVEKAIRGAGLNLNPVRDGQGRLKVPVPKQTEKARESLAKVGHVLSIRWKCWEYCHLSD